MTKNHRSIKSTIWVRSISKSDCLFRSISLHVPDAMANVRFVSVVPDTQVVSTRSEILQVENFTSITRSARSATWMSCDLLWILSVIVKVSLVSLGEPFLACTVTFRPQFSCELLAFNNNILCNWIIEFEPFLDLGVRFVSRMVSSDF